MSNKNDGVDRALGTIIVLFATAALVGCAATRSLWPLVCFGLGILLCSAVAGYVRSWGDNS